MSDPVTLVVTSTPDPNQPDALNEYVKGVVPLLLGLGGQIIKRSAIKQTIHGEQKFTTLLVMDFPSGEKLGEFFNSATYAALIPARDTAFEQIDIYFAGNLG